MPSISKIRFTNVVYEGGNKRYNDELFLFDGNNGAILLENGGGKTVFIQTALQAMLPHQDLADRKMKDTLKLEEAPAHIAIEWILNDRPRRYAVTCVSLFLTKNGLDSFRYVYEYGEHDKHSIEGIPFVKEFGGKTRAAERAEIQEYYSYMSGQHLSAKTFDTIKNYKLHLEQNYHIIPKEWESIAKINSAEGGVEDFFDECKTTSQLFDRLLIPTVEESLASFQKNEFAETFEKHRTSFKEYKQLKEKIAENERIKDRVETYVKAYEGLHEKRQSYLEAKGVAKSYAILAQQQQKAALLDLDEHTKSLTSWEEKNKQLSHKEASYEVAIEHEKLQVVSSELTDEWEKRDRLQTKFEQTNRLYFSLKLAELKKNFGLEQERKTLNETSLLDLDKEQDTEEIQELLSTNSREIKGYFSQQEEKFNQEKQELQFEFNAILSTIANDKTALSKAIHEGAELVKQEAGKQATLNRNIVELKAIQSEVLSNPAQETVPDQLPKWSQLRNELDEENMKLIQRNKLLQSENETLTHDVQQVQNAVLHANEQHIKLVAKKEQIDLEHQKLKMKLAEQKLSWSRLDSVYLKQDSIEKQIIEDIDKVAKERESLLYRERLAFRFVDDYGGQDLFHADDYLTKQLLQWKNQFSYLETGVSYTQTLPQDIYELMENYPLWPITVITSDSKEKAKLEEKVRHIHDRLQYPVIVVTLEEATAIVHGQTSEFTWIQPEHWKTNSLPESFSEWKLTQQAIAESAKSERLEKEKELQVWNQLQKEIYSFFLQYSNVDYKQILEDISQIDHQLFGLKDQEKTIKVKLSQNQREYAINLKKQTDNKEAISGYDRKIEKGYKYLSIQKENDGLEIELLYLKSKRAEMDRHIHKLQTQLKNLEEQARDLELQIRDITSHISILQDDRLYLKVKTISAAYTSKSINILEEEREQLQRDLERLTKGRGELVARIQASSDNMQRFQNDMTQLRTENSDLKEDLVYPLQGADKMGDLWSERLVAEASLAIVKESTERLTTKRDKLVGIVENMMSKMGELIEFDTHLIIIKEQLIEEKHSLKLERQHLSQAFSNLDKQMKEINDVVQELEKYDMKHSFLDSRIKESILSNDEITSFTYNRKKIVNEITDELEGKLGILLKEEGIVADEKGKYIDFCRREIKDVRMRETAIQGIEKKQTYEDVLKYKDLLEGRIQTAINYAEQNIISHDKQLEQLIIHIHTHIVKIADELKLIPKKTSVKVEDQWKEIFSFTIPEWNEHEGKADIRAHISWILEQLDKEAYKDEFGQDDIVRIKKDLEKWLQSKQLLQVVLKDQSMKVTCRKVTNDNKVTKGSYSWEQSNVWSGGEKWSKNMTLFLGILNYVAEKRQHIQPKMKRHRTVIVDNPFGKASSDHVLNPVFFIAEQLGFQIIALTAHAEGKYLRDYFPVIYSCRLRNAAGSDKQIMTKEKTIQHAYFQDHAPQSLERLGEVEQLELF
ncbi:hypothetical protein ACOI1C_00200 [Bacillus sp. DJP31]|uniref:hypothetical protein n=1 Tax=Bacillus sp. DJP31 TaxID=3409789 RepID=UPI003BB67C27